MYALYSKFKLLTYTFTNANALIFISACTAPFEFDQA